MSTAPATVAVPTVHPSVLQFLESLVALFQVVAPVVSAVDPAAAPIIAGVTGIADAAPTLIAQGEQIAGEGEALVKSL